MVSAVRCPAATCRKYMLVEDGDRGTVVRCLICKAPIKVPAPAGGPPAAPAPHTPVTLTPIPSQSGLTPTPYPGAILDAVPVEPPRPAVPLAAIPVAGAAPPAALPVARLASPPPPRP